MTNRIRPNKVNLLYNFLLVVALLGAQFVVLTHTHDSLHNTTDALCKVCISGEHLGQALTGAVPAGINILKGFFITGWIVRIYPDLFFIRALARAPPASV